MSSNNTSNNTSNDTSPELNPSAYASTTSLLSTTTVSSQTPLNPTRTPQKDYFAAFADLQSKYSAAGAHTPTFTPIVKQKKSKTSTSTSTQLQQSASSSRAPATMPFSRTSSHASPNAGGDGTQGRSSAGTSSQTLNSETSDTATEGRSASKAEKKKKSLLPWKGKQS